ncbi:MAG: hypothetical protein QG603_190, partial [Patescibacteria group bacterium]|nr:hypothetical protein [Patescibacteria group bacterium]
AFHGPSLLQIIFAVVILSAFVVFFKKTMEPKEWSAEKDENGKVVKQPSVRWFSLASCVLIGLFLPLAICWPGVVYFWILVLIGLGLDLAYVVPFLHIYSVLWFQKPVKFWRAGLHFGPPSWLPKNVFDIWNLARERIEASDKTEQLPTADTKVLKFGKKKSAKTAETSDDSTKTDEEDTFSATISLVMWMVFWTNYKPEIFIRYSRTDRDQLKTMVFNITEAYLAEQLLGLTFEEAREKTDYFVTQVDLRHEAEHSVSHRHLAEFKAMEKRGASDSEWLAFATRVFDLNEGEGEKSRQKVLAYGRFLELRNRILHLVGCFLDDIRIKDRNADPKVEEALNAVTLARLELQKALVNIEKGQAEGQAASERESEALRGVLALIKEENNAAALAVWTDFQKSTHNQNVNIGGIDIGAALAQLAKAASQNKK